MTETTRRIIITADDYGMCESVNAAIEECLAAGSMRATCVMTNMPLWEAARQLRQRFPDASIGVHWTLTQGPPVLPPAVVRTLVGPDGRLLPFRELRRRAVLGQVDRGQVRAELTGQFARFVEAAGRPDFWNTHENIHVTPGLFALCVELGRELGIPAMRCQRRITAPMSGTPRDYAVRHPLYWAKGQVIAAWSARAERGGTRMPDGAVHTPGYRAGADPVESAVGRIPWGQVRRAAELIIHPATRIEPELFGNLTDSRVRDYAAFRDPGLRGRLLAAGVTPVGFEVLADGR